LEAEAIQVQNISYHFVEKLLRMAEAAAVSEEAVDAASAHPTT
jgi:hypothetical protein